MDLASTPLLLPRVIALASMLALAGCSLILETRPAADAGRTDSAVRDAQTRDALDVAIETGGSDAPRVDAAFDAGHDGTAIDASDAQRDHDALDSIDVPLDRGVSLDTVDVPADRITTLDITDVPIDRPAAIDATSTDGCVGGSPCGFTCATPYDAVTNGSYAINPCGTAPSATLVCAGVTHTAVTTYWAFNVPTGGCHVTWPVGYIVLEQTARCATSGVCCADATCAGSQALVEGQHLFAIQRADATCEVNLVEIFCP